MYEKVFFTNIIRLMEEKNISGSELCRISGVSQSFISDIRHGKGNPSIKTMGALADALSTPLPLLLEPVEPEVWRQLGEDKEVTHNLPENFEYVAAILTSPKAFQVKQWDKEARNIIKKYSKNNR